MNLRHLLILFVLLTRPLMASSTTIILDENSMMRAKCIALHGLQPAGEKSTNNRNFKGIAQQEHLSDHEQTHASNIYERP